MRSAQDPDFRLVWVWNSAWNYLWQLIGKRLLGIFFTSRLPVGSASLNCHSSSSRFTSLTGKRWKATSAWCWQANLVQTMQALVPVQWPDMGLSALHTQLSLASLPPHLHSALCMSIRWPLMAWAGPYDLWWLELDHRQQLLLLFLWHYQYSCRGVWTVSVQWSFIRIYLSVFKPGGATPSGSPCCGIAQILFRIHSTAHTQQLSPICTLLCSANIKLWHSQCTLYLI